jgi:putative glutamine amidotransferase
MKPKKIAVAFGDKPQKSDAAYLQAVKISGGAPVPLRPREDFQKKLAECDALLLTGGGDVEPKRYGGVFADEILATIEGVDPARDAMELELIARALQKNMPILAICRGAQVLNVALGGTLVPHLRAHPRGEHKISIEPRTRLRKIFGANAVNVNSSHHQALDKLGNGLKISARAADGTVEAVELPKKPVLAVQFHPERMLEKSPKFLALFQWLIKDARCGAR